MYFKKLINPRKEKDRFREITLNPCIWTHQLQAGRMSTRDPSPGWSFSVCRQHLGPVSPLCFHITLSFPASCICPQQVCKSSRAGPILTPCGDPGLEHSRSFMKCRGGTHGTGLFLGGQGQGGRRRPHGHSDLRRPSGDGRHPQHCLAPAHVWTGALRRCLGQILGVLCPGRMTFGPHSVNSLHTCRPLRLQEALSPIAAPCAETLTPGRLPQNVQSCPGIWGRPPETWSRASQTFLDPETPRDVETRRFLLRGSGGGEADVLVWKIWQEIKPDKK